MIQLDKMFPLNGLISIGDISQAEAGDIRPGEQENG